MFQLTGVLSDRDKKILQSTISPYAFYMLCQDALDTGGLSVVRMGDGERVLYEFCDFNERNPVLTLENIEHSTNNGERLKRLGLQDITLGHLKHLMSFAATECTYFAPSISGVANRKFDLYSHTKKRDFYVDNFFVNVWTEEMKINLYKKAGSILIIHNNPLTAGALQIRAEKFLGIKVEYIRLTKWQDCDDVVAKAKLSDAKLVLFSAGPAGKWIAPAIHRQSVHWVQTKYKDIQVPMGKVVLDIGNTMDSFILYETWSTANSQNLTNKSSYPL